MNEITIGNKIAEGRRLKNLSQAQFAEMLNISKQAVGKWERGESMPDIIMLGRIAALIGVDVNSFYYDDKNVLQSQHSNKSKNLSFMSLKDSDFTGLDNLNEKFGYASVENCKFTGADLKGIIFKSNNLKGNDFTDANMEGSKFLYESIVKNNFTNVNFRGLEEKGCNLTKNNFTNADFTNATLSSSNINGNDFTSVVLHGTEFKKCNISSAKFSGAIKDCSFVGCTFRKVEFNGVTLNNVFFKNKVKGAIFKDCKADKITYAFLKSAKADLSGVIIIE